MKIAVYGRNIAESIGNYELVINKLKANNNAVCVYKAFADFLQPATNVCDGCSTFLNAGDLSNDTSFIVSLGGDGTFLESARFVRANNIPIIGINTGSLGFLASIAIDKLDEAMHEIEQNKYKIEKRSLIQVNTQSASVIEAHGLNEMSIQRTKPALISASVFVNKELLADYWADGLIIATPTGSTAYSMSVGGPIIVPTAANFVISPIAPHNLAIRPVVIPDDVEVTIEVKTRGEAVTLTVDNQMFELASGDKINVKKSPYCVNIIKPDGVNFYTTLKNKLFWGFDQRNAVNVYQHLK